jgi:nucleoredoxin
VQDEFSDYYAEMPWLALPFRDSRTDAFKTAYRVEGIPSLVLVGPDGHVLTEDGRDHILR